MSAQTLENDLVISHGLAVTQANLKQQGSRKLSMQQPMFRRVGMQDGLVIGVVMNQIIRRKWRTSCKARIQYECTNIGKRSCHFRWSCGNPSQPETTRLQEVVQVATNVQVGGYVGLVISLVMNQIIRRKWMTSCKARIYYECANIGKRFCHFRWSCGNPSQPETTRLQEVVQVATNVQVVGYVGRTSYQPSYGLDYQQEGSG